MACYVESSGVAPSRFATALGARAGFFEAASIRVQPDGSVQALLGTHNHGQGHATTFAQIIASRLGVPMAQVEIIEGDTDQVPFGTGTFGSRSIAVGGSALDRAAMKIVAKGKLIAAHLLEASVPDIHFADGVFAIAGTDRQVTLREVARAAHIPSSYPADLEPGLQDTAVYDPPSFAWSNGAHVCEVEVDPATGAVAIAGYWAVDDVGTVINPMIVEGQILGGIAQGLGQALREHCVYDAASGQLLAGSFMDYAIPRAEDMPDVGSELDESQPCTHNPLGAKGCGEAGAIGAPAAIVGAVLDALRPLGVSDLELPLTPERVWSVIHAAERRPPAPA
jgi:aerobic carbon-monoxide dehydrogenase large subunit